MYIRRKVFSLLQDENGEEKYFSTTEFTDERLYSDAGIDMINLSRKGAGMDKIDSPAKEATKKVISKGKKFLKETYGKEAKHRGRNIAITAAVPVVATSGVIAGKAIKAKKAKKEISDKE